MDTKLKKAATEWSEGFSNQSQGVAFTSFKVGAEWQKEQQGEGSIPPFWKRVMTELPKGFVLAKNNRGDIKIGALYKDPDDQSVVCRSGLGGALWNVKLYLTLEDLSKLKAEK